MSKQHMVDFIANTIENLSSAERDLLKRDLMKMKITSIRWLMEHIEDRESVNLVR